MRLHSLSSLSADAASRSEREVHTYFLALWCFLCRWFAVGAHRNGEKRVRMWMSASVSALLCLLALAGSAGATPTWTQRTPTNSPSARYLSTMVYDSARGVSVIFGGYSNNVGNYLNETWEYNGTTWTQKTPTNSPSARYGV